MATYRESELVDFNLHVRSVEGDIHIINVLPDEILHAAMEAMSHDMKFEDYMAQAFDMPILNKKFLDT